MKPIINNIKLKTLNGETYKFPKNIYYVMKEAVNRSNQKLDNVIIYTGSVGSGKSNLSKGANGTYSEVIRKKPYTLDDVYFLIDKVLESFDRQDNKGSVINYDEAIQGASGRDGISKLGKKLRVALITKRTKRHLISLCVDNPKELNDKIIERCLAWYHVFYIRTNKGKYVKGLFKVFKKEDLRTIYNDLKNYKYRFVEEHPIFKKNIHIYKSYDYSDIFYNEEQYDLKKGEETSNLEDDDKSKPLDDKRIRNIKIVAGSELGVKQAVLASAYGLSISGIQKILRETTLPT